MSGDVLFQLLQNTPANDIEKFEIIPTPTAKYDANAQAVVNIVFIKNPLDGLTGTAFGGIGGGVHLRYTGGLDLNYHKNNLNIYGGYNYEHNMQYYNTSSARELSAEDNVSENVHETRTRNNHSFKLGLDYDIDKNNTIGALVSGYDNLRGRQSSDNVALMHTANIPDSFSNVALQGHANFFNPSVNIYYKSKLDTSGRTLTLNANYMNFHQKWYDNYTTTYSPFQPSYYLRDSTPVNDNVYSFSADYENPIKNGNIQAGLKTTYTITDNNILWQYLSGNDWIVTPTLTNHFIYKENVNAGYFNLDKTWGKYELNAGLRVEQTSTRGDQKISGEVHDTGYWGFFPTLVLNYTKNDNNQFAVSFRRTVVRPSFIDVNPFIIYQSQYSYTSGNPDLQPEYDNDLNFTYTFKQAWNIGADYIISQNDIATILINGPDSAVGISTGNIHTETSFTPFVSYTGVIAKRWNLTFANAVQYSDFKQQYSNGYKLNNSGWTYLGQMQNAIGLGKGLTAELDLLYRSSIADGVYYFKPVFQTDFGLQKSIMHGNGKLSLSATDIFNTVKTKYSTTFMGINESIVYKPESRYVMLRFTYRFGNKNVKPHTDRENMLDDIHKRLGGN